MSLTVVFVGACGDTPTLDLGPAGCKPVQSGHFNQFELARILQCSQLARDGRITTSHLLGREEHSYEDLCETI
jgi:hypothetical protein